jgi:hypothetical protein
VSERNSPRGRLFTFLMRAETTLSLSFPFTFTSRRYREYLSTSVATWVFLRPVIRSPSQCPGLVRAAICRGRSWMEMASMI